jgi:hypothetical protein
MNQFAFGRKMFFALIAALLVIGASQRTADAQQQPVNNQHSLGDRGGTRSGNGQTMSVMAKLNGKGWGKATVVVTAADGTQVDKGVTDATGTYTNNSLAAGTYTVTVSTAHYTATQSVTIVQSTDTNSVTLTLTKKPVAQ